MSDYTLQSPEIPILIYKIHYPSTTSCASLALRKRMGYALVLRSGVTKDHVKQDCQLADFTIQMRVIRYAVVSPFNGSWNYALASVSSYKTSDNFTTLA